MTVARLEREMTFVEFRDWIAFFSVEAAERERAEAQARARRGR